MTNRRKALWAVAAIITLLVLAAISIPNLSRSRRRANMAFTGLSAEYQVVEQQDKLALFAQIAPAPNQLPGPNSKLIHNAELELVVGDVRAATEQIRKLVDLNHGEIDKLEIRDSSGGSVSATLAVRVPASGLENSLTGGVQESGGANRTRTGWHT